MKKLITILLLLITLQGFTQVTPGCWANGFHSFIGTNLPNGVAHIEVVNNMGMSTGEYSVNYSITNGALTFLIPQPDQYTEVRIRVSYADGSCELVWSTNVCCSTTTVKFTLLQAKRLGDGKVQVDFESTEEGVKSYRVQVSFDGINFKTKTVVSPGRGRHTVILKP